MKWYYLVLSLAVISLQETSAQVLPRGLSDQEKQMLADGLFRPATQIPGEHLTRNPPPESLRAIAEWEEMQAIVITWAGYQSVLREIVRNAKEELRVIIVTNNETSVRNYLENNGIDLSENVEFIDSDFNSVWVRDYGANPVYLNDVDSLRLVDWIYNRPRPKDDAIPYAVADYLGVPIYGTVEAPNDLVNTGGNFMSDGLGRGFSSNLVLTENGPFNNFGQSNHSEEEVNAIMREYMGINEYVKMPVLPYDGIHHIDMHMKLVDESTLIVGKYPDGIADGPQIEANIQYVIEQFKQTTGRDYRLIRVPMPPDAGDDFPDLGGDYRTYANAMFVNGSILVPVYEEQYDTTALRIWRETMPGYNVVGINCNTIIPASGALHCIIKEVAIERPLWISHLQPEELTAEQHNLEAQIKHISGIATSWLFYRIAGTTEYDSTAMQLVGDDVWSGTLPEFGSDSQIEYYFKATANDGKSITRPIPAPAGYFRVSVDGTPSSVSPDIQNAATLWSFPNPATAMTCVPVTVSHAESGTLSLSDLHGRQILTIHSGSFPSGESKYFFDAGRLPRGCYALTLTTEHEQLSRIVVVQ